MRYVVQMFCDNLGIDFKQAKIDVEERLGQDAAYIIDSGRARKEFNWRPQIGIEQGVNEVIDWVMRDWDKIESESLEYVHQP